MKTIGLIGGMSWESTVTYYQAMNLAVKERLGGYHCAKLVMYNVDFAELESRLHTEDFAGIAEILSDAARRLERAGADCVLIGTNTMHQVANEVQSAVRIPLLHIADAAADALIRDGRDTVALMGTKVTMERDFFRARLEKRGLTVLIPDENERELLHRVIFDELCLGELRPESKAAYLRVVDHLAERGAQGVILGCTEIGLLIQQSDTKVPLYDTTILHADAAVRFALGQ